MAQFSKKNQILKAFEKVFVAMDHKYQNLANLD